MLTLLAKSGGHGGDEASQGEWRTGKVLPPLESRNRMEPRPSRNFSGDAGRPERREMLLPSIESGVDKWERRGPLPVLDTSDRRPRTGPGSGPTSRSISGTFGNPANRSPSRESLADTAEWRSSKSMPSIVLSDGSISSCIMTINIADTPPPASPSLGSPVMQRRKLALLPRSEHPQEPTPVPVSIDEVKPKSNPFGAAKPVDTDNVLKKVEEKLAKEKEHKEELASIKANIGTSKPPPASPTGPRHNKSRANPKQLLRRGSPNLTTPTSAANETDAVVTAKPEVQEKAKLEGSEETWRKPDNTAAPAPPEDEAGWETVSSRSKKVNGVGVRH